MWHLVWTLGLIGNTHLIGWTRNRGFVKSGFYGKMMNTWSEHLSLLVNTFWTHLTFYKAYSEHLYIPIESTVICTKITQVLPYLRRNWWRKLFSSYKMAPITIFQRDFTFHCDLWSQRFAALPESPRRFSNYLVSSLTSITDGGDRELLNR